MSSILNEFKAFAVKGNAVDMAVGVIIGGAFGKIVSSIVNDIIMPPIGWLIGGVNFSDLKFELPSVQIAGETMQAATINYGAFIQTIIDFVIMPSVCLCLSRASTSFRASRRRKKRSLPRLLLRSLSLQTKRYCLLRYVIC